MAPSNSIGEVSEVRFQVLNVCVLMQLTVRSSDSPLNCVCDLQTILGAHCVSRQPFVGVENHRKHLHFQGLDALVAHSVLARLARLREVMVLGLTSPGKPSETLGFHTKARLARLFPPMLTHVHARVRMRRINNFAYRSGLKLTSPNLANLAGRSASAVDRVLHACGRRTTLRTDASSLRSRPLASIIALIASVGQQWPHGASATMALARNARPPADGSSPKKHRDLGPREQPRD